MKSTTMPNNTTMHHTAPPDPTTTPKNFRSMRRLCGLALAAIGLSASIASAQTIPVANGNFETEYGTNTDKTTNWVKLTNWSLENTVIGRMSIAGNFSSDPDGGSYFTRFTWNNAGVEQNLNTAVSAADTLSVTFNLGVSLGAWGPDAWRVKGNVYFLVDSTYYKMPYDLTGQTAGVWTTLYVYHNNIQFGKFEHRFPKPRGR